MTAIKQAQAAGYTHVRTLAGNVPLADWAPFGAESLTLEGDRLVGPWREPSTLEEMILEKQGKDPAVHVSRDTWPLSVEASA